jgi:uncharacterized membrane protein YvbJ
LSHQIGGRAGIVVIIVIIIISASFCVEFEKYAALMDWFYVAVQTNQKRKQNAHYC